MLPVCSTCSGFGFASIRQVVTEVIDSLSLREMSDKAPCDKLASQAARLTDSSIISDLNGSEMPLQRSVSYKLAVTFIEWRQTNSQERVDDSRMMRLVYQILRERLQLSSVDRLA